MHISVGLVTRSGRLASAISGNPLLYQISVRDFLRPERVVLVVQVCFPQKNPLIFNLLSACLHPHISTTHTKKLHPPELEIPITVCHIIIILIILFCGPHCVRLYINNKRQKKLGINCLRPYLLHELTQHAPKQEICMHFMKKEI